MRQLAEAEGILVKEGMGSREQIQSHRVVRSDYR